MLLHKSAVTWGLLALVAVVGGICSTAAPRRSRLRGRERLFQARQAAATGTSTRSLRPAKVVTRYEGTRAGTRQRCRWPALYEDKKFKEGIEALKKAESKAPDDSRRPYTS